MDKEFFELKVLYVEDSDLIRNTGSEIIKSKVRELVVAKDGAEGLEMYKSHQPDLVITDIGMPEMDGLTMSRHIMQINPDAVIIITTAYDENKYIKEALSIGIQEYILKSSLRSQLVKTINKWYDKIIAEKRKKANFDFTALISQKIMQYAPIIIMVANGHGIIEYVNSYFCEQTGYSQEEALGQKPGLLKSNYHPKEYYDQIWRTIKSGNNWQGHFKNRRKDGSLYDENAVIIPIVQDDNQIAYFLKFAQVTSCSGESVKQPEISKIKKCVALIETDSAVENVEDKIKTLLPFAKLTLFKE